MRIGYKHYIKDGDTLEAIRSISDSISANNATVESLALANRRYSEMLWDLIHSTMPCNYDIYKWRIDVEKGACLCVAEPRMATKKELVLMDPMVKNEAGDE